MTVQAQSTNKVSVDEAKQIAVDAYIYGYSLITTNVTCVQMTNVPAVEELRGPVNNFINVKRYPPADYRGVSAPNADMLYSVARLDLGKEPIVFTYPDMGAEGTPYRESVLRAQAIADGVENGPEGPAAAANLAEFSGLAEQSRSPQSVETLSDSLPYSRNSLYGIEQYDPGSLSSDPNGGSAGNPTPARNNEVDSIVAKEVDQLRASENQTIRSLQGAQLPQTTMSHFTQTDGKLQSDANWVQFQLDINQMRWNSMANSTISDEMLADVNMQLKARMQLASRFTKSDQLRAALTQ